VNRKCYMERDGDIIRAEGETRALK